MSLNKRRSIGNGKLVAIFNYCDFFMRNNSYNGENRAVWFPAFGAAASMIVRNLTFNTNFHRPVRTGTNESAPGESVISLLNPVINCRSIFNLVAIFLLL